MPEGIQTELTIRVVSTYNAGNKEICRELPHLHSSHWEIVAWQPGNPGSSALGSFTVPLFPPGSEGYKAAKPYYDALDYFQRVEAYVGGRLMFSGIITEIKRTYGENAMFELSGQSDVVLANLSAPFPGELLSNDVTSAMLKSYLGTNELGASDTFNPYTSGNYTSGNLPSLSAGTWSGATDDGFNVVNCATGTGAALISKTGAAANDRWHSQFVEITGRLNPSADATNAGKFGVGISSSSADCTNCCLGYVTAYKSGGRYSLNATIAVYAASVLTAYTTQSVLTNVDDPQSIIPLTVGLLCTIGGTATTTATATLTVNGKVVASAASAYDPSTTTKYPFLFFGTPATGSATASETNLVQMTRYTTDGPATSATFGNGTITTSTHSIAYGMDPGPSFLEAWSKFATREAFYWRYTPQPYTVGVRTLGTVDFEADPGTDYGSNQTIVFSESLGNLISVELNANADQAASGTAVAAQSSPDGGGIGFWRDINTMTKHGVIEDQTLAFTAADFNSARRAAYQIVSNKTNLGSSGSKTIKVLRDPQTADKFRELDKVMLHCPELGLNYLTARVIGYTWDENLPTQVLTLDQFSADNLTLLNKRLQTGVFESSAAVNRAQGSGGGAGLFPPAQNQFNNTLAQTISGNSFTTITGSPITVNLSRTTSFLLIGYLSVSWSSGAQTGIISPFVDGTQEQNMGMGPFPNTSLVATCPVCFMTGPLAPGNHTFDLRMNAGAVTTYIGQQFALYAFQLG